MTVLGADRLSAGVVSDVWVDKAEYLIRYLEVELGAPTTGGLSVVGATASGGRVLLPMTMATVDKGRRQVKVDAILASQFANVPPLSNPDQVTLDEEERITAYYGAGYLYATPERLEPLI
jgi:photosynthetic reaction center H subunit